MSDAAAEPAAGTAGAAAEDRRGAIVPAVIGFGLLSVFAPLEIQPRP